MYKKGVSPLIATVLLLAFAVALATVIMQINFFGGCSSKVQISSINNVKRICYDEGAGEIIMFIRNDDTARSIFSFKMTISGQDGSENPEISQSIGPQKEEKIVVPYDSKVSGSILKVTISPQVNISNRPEACDMPDEIGPIPACS
jgi:flagellin-like protein